MQLKIQHDLLSKAQDDAPAVSIVIPVYNRQKFIAGAIRSIQDQSFRDWELIIVDDGSTDETVSECSRCLTNSQNAYRIIQQNNAGAGAARATGISACRGEYIAFLDSDDLWKPDHLESCIHALRNNPDIDWICSDMERVIASTGKVLRPSIFHSKEERAAFLDLPSEIRGDVKVLPKHGLVTHLIKHDGFHSLQSSVIRGSVFENIAFPPFRVGEDRVLAILAAINNYSLAYIDKVQVRFLIHTDHTAAVEDNLNLTKRTSIYTELLNAYGSLTPKLRNDHQATKELKRRMAREHFWTLGYNTYWKGGEARQALKEYAIGIKLHPFNLIFWKTAITCYLKSIARHLQSRHQSDQHCASQK